MSRHVLATALLAGAALAASGCSLKPQKAEPKLAQPEYVFPHDPHVEGEVACTNCHAGIAGSSKLEQGVRHVQLPAHPSKEKACSGCHDSDPEIHVPSRTEAFRLHFNHQAHLSDRVKGGDCKVCHQKLPEKGDTAATVPPMAACTSCHNHQADFEAAKCTRCHTDLKGYLPKTTFSHQGDWMKAHGSMAKPSAASCAACHDQTYCAECHAAQNTAARPSIIFPEEVQRAFIHRGDYVSRHQVDAQANPASCRTCHGSAFCSSCHTQQGLTNTAINVRDPHPAGWATDKGTNHFHGDAARRDILSCAGCHDNGAASTCVACHQMGGVGGNPHPSAFLNKHDADDRQHNSMCKACHFN
jgi:hypothetical protein